MMHLFSFLRRSACSLAAMGLGLVTAGAAQAQTFTPSATYSTGIVPQGIASADVNGDGRLDLIMTNSNSNTVGVLLGSATTPGTFPATATFYGSGGTFPVQVGMGDVNGDGRPDIVVDNANSNNVSVLLNSATTPGTFATAVAYPSSSSGPRGLGLADVNGDGRLDVVVGGSGTIGVLLNSASTPGTFATGITYPTGVDADAIAVGDVNGDGRPDVAVTGYFTANTIIVLLNSASTPGTFPTATSYGSGGGTPRGVTFGDVNADGRPDLVVGNESSGNNVGVLLNSATAPGTFGTAVAYPSGANGPNGVRVRDMNGDGRSDIVAANYDVSNGSTVSVLLGSATTPGTFATGTTYSSGGQGPVNLEVSDLNNDGRPDIATTNVLSSTIGVLLNTSLFTAPTLSSINPTSGPVGTSVTLTGTNLTGATAVRFNGTAATTFAVVNATTVTATVPAGATTGNVTVTTPIGTSNGVAFTVTAPTTVVSIVRADPNPTNAASVQFTLTFAAPVTGLSLSNFSVTFIGSGFTSFGSITGFSGSGTTYTVTVNTGSGSGDIRLNLANSTGLTPSVSNVPYVTGEQYTIDKTAPTVAISSTAATGSTTSTTPFAFTVTFSESVTGFVQGDLTVSNGTVSGFSGAGTTYTFNVTPTTAGTATTVNVPQNVAQDQAGNGNTAAAAAYSLTFQAPTITVTPATLPNGTQGTAYSQTLTAAGGTAPYAFAFTAGTLPSGLTLASNGTLAGTPTANGSFNFTVTATDASAAPGPFSGSIAYTLTIAAPAVTAVIWTGSIDSNWYTTGNWTPTQVPTATTDATIPTAPSGDRFPAITNSAANARNLTLNSGASLTQTGGTLALAAGLTNNGTFQPTGGTVSLGGTTLSNIQGSGNTRFWNLTVGANGAQSATSASTSVQRLLTLNGNFTTNGNPFKLESNASGTAMVVNNGNNVVNGTVTVQRYIATDLNPNQGYRHISAPIGNATVGSLATSGFTPVVNPAYNGSATPYTVTPFPTVYGYDQARLATTNNNLIVFDKGWFSPAATDALAGGQGYTALISGGQTWNFTGALNNGNVTQALARNAGPTAADAGWALIGNPYPSPLDWFATSQDAGALVNVGTTMYVYQSNDPSNPYAGAYGFFNNGIGTISNILPLGQGFFVRVADGQTAGSVTFKNSHRPTSYAPTTYRRTTETRPLVELNLQSAGSALTDAAFVYFEQGATDSFDRTFDSEKLPNPSGLNLSTSLTATQRLAIDGRAPLGTAQRVVPLAVGVPATGSYTLSAAQLLNLSTTPVYLRDLLTGAVIDLHTQSSYAFTVANASALLTSRFELVFSPQGPLATATAALAAQVGLYPNPATAAAFVELPAFLGRAAVAAELVDALGRTVRSQSLSAQGAAAHRLDLANLSTGVYTLHLRTSTGVIVKKLVVE
ncbi:FG-GAP-like repeat-containing protein [Hymenobacter negativus]|uniref:VCBS repeat-containing protein n=1 Tax=Hymenobacter negativus TaxID=2795026 RepID=A0ABS3QBG9_9BACT|nr:FG-GAP-like repeat-containing protein [Hymenobacter negativus]MBO2008536.1 VCBS repeat-containing protein [Hymenobacter negativus]